MRLYIAVLFAIAIVLPSLRALEVSAEDEASFYMNPGEKASNVPLIAGNKEYLLVLANARPVALLQKRASGTSAMDDPAQMDAVLRLYVGNGFPAILLISADGESYGESLRTEMLSRIPSALRRRLVFTSDEKLRLSRERRDALFTEYNRYRDVNFGSLDSQLMALDEMLSQMRKSKSLEAAQKFVINFDKGEAAAAQRMDLLEDSLADHSGAASAIAGASRSIEIAKPRIGGESVAYASLQRDLTSIDYDLTLLEAELSTGGRPGQGRFALVESAARSLSSQAASQARGDSFPWHIASLVFALAFVAAAAILLRERLAEGKENGEKEGVGARILRRIRQYEDKAERQERKQ